MAADVHGEAPTFAPDVTPVDPVADVFAACLDDVSAALDERRHPRTALAFIALVASHRPGLLCPPPPPAPAMPEPVRLHDPLDDLLDELGNLRPMARGRTNGRRR